MRGFVIASMLFCCAELLGQSNLVPNPSFEEYTSCPTYLHQLSNANSWNSAYGSLDYFNGCSTAGSIGPIFTGVPSNMFGTQNAHTGIAYAGFVSYVNPVSPDREYMQTLLLDYLTSGTEYEVSIYLSLPDGKVSNPVGPIGVYFKNDTVATPYGGNLSFCCTPQITFNEFPTDTVEWMHLSTNYIASGGERLMIIGNFATNPNCLFNDNPDYSVSSYFYIDDVSVTLAEDPTSSENNESVVQIPNVFSPNQDNVNDIFQTITHSEIQEAHLLIINRWGQKVFETNAISNGWDGTCNAQNCSDGTYFCKVEYINVSGKKEIKSGFVQLVR